MGAQAEGRGIVQVEGACHPGPEMYVQRCKAGVVASDAKNVCGLLPSPSQ